MATSGVNQTNAQQPLDEPWFGSYRELGKTEARQSFLRLLDELKDEQPCVAITDRGERVAVVMGYKQFQVLMAAVRQQVGHTEKPLAGLIANVGDLDKSKGAVEELFQESFKRMSGTL